MYFVNFLSEMILQYIKIMKYKSTTIYWGISVKLLRWSPYFKITEFEKPLTVYFAMDKNKVSSEGPQFKSDM